MKRKSLIGIVFLLVLALLAGCSAQTEPEETSAEPMMKPVINFEGIVTAVDGGSVTLEDGRTVLITEETAFAADPDGSGEVSDEILVGNYIQGYTADDAEADTVTAANVWSNMAPTGGKMAVNFEGRVTQVANGRVTLEDGRIVLVTEVTEVTSADGDTEIAAGDYIQGYSADPEAEEITAENILITVL